MLMDINLTSSMGTVGIEKNVAVVPVTIEEVRDLSIRRR